MKMENVLKAQADGVVSSLEAKQGQAVEKNQVLIKFS
jgi:biotin carboxyl carrier protein